MCIVSPRRRVEITPPGINYSVKSDDCSVKSDDCRGRVKGAGALRFETIGARPRLGGGMPWTRLKVGLRPSPAQVGSDAPLPMVVLRARARHGRAPAKFRSGPLSLSAASSVPHARQHPTPELLVDRTPLAEVVERITPGRSGPRDSEQPDQYQAVVPRPPPATRTRLDQERRKERPLLIRHQDTNQGAPPKEKP